MASWRRSWTGLLSCRLGLKAVGFERLVGQLLDLFLERGHGLSELGFQARRGLISPIFQHDRGHADLLVDGV